MFGDKAENSSCIIDGSMHLRWTCVSLSERLVLVGVVVYVLYAELADELNQLTIDPTSIV